MFEFELILKQQPTRARITGFSNDRRVIRPTIVQLVAREDSHELKILPEAVARSLLCAIFLIEVEPASKICTDSTGYDKNAALRSQDNLLGNAISSVHFLHDLDMSRGMFFVFSDLAIRTPGKYMLKCCLIDLSSDKSRFPVSATVFSKPFPVQSPRNYSGAPAHSKLARHFHRQGVDMKIY
ncbi:velvet factor [Gorgonomyces haynaldii]|nr:velvet factor [Gorgonomyces haynaldii]